MYMKINPGGKLSLEDIVGRDPLVARVTQDLRVQSIILVAERRMGKTHVLDKLVAAAPSGWVMLKRDVEGVRTTLEFVQLVMADLHPMLTKFQRFREWLNTIAVDAAGIQIGPVKLPNFPAKHWKQILIDTLGHVGDDTQTQFVVFLWDELPMMLQNIAKSSPHEAMELLDVLRSLRQENPKIRMVFTGSIGLHHVVRHLKEQGYANAPVNDMAVVEVPPLSPMDATSLAKQLFSDNQIAAADASIFALVAAQVDGIPFYIHHVMRALVDRKPGSASAVTSDEVLQIVDAAIRSAHDPWNLKHYEDRTRDYYGNNREACHALIDGVATAATSMPVQTAINGAKSVVLTVGQDTWLELIRLLERDYYLTRDGATGNLQFKFSIVKRWWCWSRGLTSSESSAV